MYEVVIEAGWDVLLFAIPFVGMLLMSFSRLGRLIAAVKNEERASYSGFERPVWDMDAEGQPLLTSERDALLWLRVGRS
jgi:hypothetical protein